jgi:hypothetical protein
VSPTGGVPRGTLITVTVVPASEDEGRDKKDEVNDEEKKEKKDRQKEKEDGKGKD